MKKWYKVTYVTKRGGIQAHTAFVQAETAKAARESFDSVCEDVDRKRRSYGLNPKHRFQIKVTVADSKDVDSSQILIR